jgi:hypothetical protein
MKPRRKKELRTSPVISREEITECLDYIDRLERLIGSITGQAFNAGHKEGYVKGYRDGKHDARMNGDEDT